MSATSPSKTLVLDLDETLVFASLEASGRPAHELHLAGQTVYVEVRPGVAELLAMVAEHWTVMAWSTGQPIYVEAVCDLLDMGDRQGWARDRCRRLDAIPEHHHEPYDKPLDKIGVPLDSIVIVDNAPGTFACNPDNGIPITAWHGDPADRQLILLGHYLRWLGAQTDVRRHHWAWAAEVMLLRNAVPGDFREPRLG